MSQISIVEFQEQHVEDVSRILAKSFITLNKAWKNSNLPFSEVVRIMRGKVLPALQSLMTFVILSIYSGHSLRRQADRSERLIRHAGHIQDANNAQPLGLP